MKCLSILAVSAVWCVMPPLIAKTIAAEGLDQAAQEHLLAKAAEWGVPQPDAGAGLVKVWVYQSGARDFYALGFRKKEDAGRALVGFDYWDITNRVDVKDVPDPQSVSLEDVTSTSPFSEVHGVNFGLVTGLQLVRAKNSRVGLKLIEKSLQQDAGHHRSAFRSPPGEAPIVMLARSCLADAMNQITSAKPDFLAIKQRIETILKDQPQLKSQATDWALEGLAESVKHEPAPPGTTVALIDDYLLSGGVQGAMSLLRGEYGNAERALILKGFEAVPALLERRGSKRLTNHLMQGFNNFASYPMNAGQVLNAYLQRLANDELGSNWLDKQKGHTPENDAVLAWWQKASKMGEKAYVEKHTIVPKNKDEAQLSHELLLIARERYPELLPGLYREILETSTPSWPVAEAVVGSVVPIEQKIELLSTAIATNHQAHRNAALRLLQELRGDLSDEHLIRLLNKAPKTAKEAYWTDQDAGLGALVSKSVNKQVWRALNAVLDRADLGMQMELIDHLKPPRDAPPLILRSYFEIYDRFCDDKRIRDESTSKKFSGPGAGFPHDRLAMRDFIHRHWARWLDLEIKSPEEGATPKEWSVFRAQVTKALRKTRADQDRADQPATPPESMPEGDLKPSRRF